MAQQTFASHLVSSWTRNPRGRAVLAAWAVAAAGLTITSVLARRRARAAAAAAASAKRADDDDDASTAVVAPPPPPAAASSAPVRKAPSATRLVLRALVPSYRSAPAAHAASLALAIGLRRWAATKVSAEIGALGGLLATRDWEALFAREVQFAIWTLPTAALAAATQYATARLALALRERLESRWRAAVAAGAAARVASAGAAGCAAGVDGGAVSSPAEVSLIVTAESDALCTELAALFAGIAKPSLEAAMLICTLGALMGGRQLGGALAFYALAGGWVRAIGPAWAALRERQAAAAAELAGRHARLQAHGETTHALGAEAAEAAALGLAWDAAARARGALEAQTLLSSTVETYTLRYVGILAAFTAMTPAVYAAAAGGGGAAAAGATEYFLSSLHLLVDLGLCMRDLAGAARVARTVDGLAGRVLRLLADLDAAAAAARAAAGGAVEGVVGGKSGRRVLTDGECLELVGVTITAPVTGRAPVGEGGAAQPAALVRALSVKLAAGESLLVRGPNGAGKTALLRVLSGWWTPDSGEVRVPQQLKLGYLPQRPLVVAEHSLRQALLYPDDVEAHAARRAPTDGELATALREVGLASLLGDASGGGLDAAGACAGLSGGEAQRLAAARALLARPAFLLLDEPAAATSAEFELWLYAELKRRGIGAITVSHSAAAEAQHARVLELGGVDGQYTLRASGVAC
jgi:ATP-binding cassette subfamily D (ALD) long-chain fatty acid import protein